MEPWDYFCVWTNLILTVVANLVLKGASQCTCSTTQCFMIMYHVNNSWHYHIMYYTVLKERKKLNNFCLCNIDYEPSTERQEVTPDSFILLLWLVYCDDDDDLIEYILLCTPWMVEEKVCFKMRYGRRLLIVYKTILCFYKVLQHLQKKLEGKKGVWLWLRGCENFDENTEGKSV